MNSVLLKNGTVVDGTRKKPYQADVLIRDGLIADIGKIEAEAACTIDVSGKVISPGFIDIHTHSDAGAIVSYRAECKPCQGVTTEIGGNCGISIVPSEPSNREAISEYFCSELQYPLRDAKIDFHTVTEYAKRAKLTPQPSNYGLLIGHGTLRACVMGFGGQEPTEAELDAMCRRLEKELDAGAFGLSLGLIYPPSAFAGQAELDALARVVKKKNCIMTAHIRNEGPRVFEALDEVLGIAERTGVHLEISHFKVMTKSLWGQSDKLLERVDRARSRGVNVTCDQYPYSASSTSLSALLPKWAHDGGPKSMVARAREMSEELLRDVAAEMESRGGPDCVLVVSTRGQHTEWEERTIRDLSGILACSPEEAVLKVLADCNAAVACVYFSQYQEDVLRILSRPDVSVISDGYNFSYDRSVTTDLPHPRSFGTFPRALALAREQKLMPIEDIVYKMTGLPASVVGIKDRGTLAVGKVADVVVFDPETVRDAATFTDSIQRPVGIEQVFVAGVPVVRDGQSTDAAPGRVLLHGHC